MKNSKSRDYRKNYKRDPEEIQRFIKTYSKNLYTTKSNNLK